MYILTKYSFCFSARLTTCISSIIDSTGIKLYVFVVRNKGQSYLYRRRSLFYNKNHTNVQARAQTIDFNGN